MPHSTLPKRSSRVVVGAACAASVWLSLASAVAQSAAHELQPVLRALEYTAPASCPDRSAWLSQVRSRLGQNTSAMVRPLRTRVVIAASGTEATLVFADGGGQRHISGVDCNEVASASALIVAIALGSSAQAANAHAPNARAAAEAPPPAPIPPRSQPRTARRVDAPAVTPSDAEPGTDTSAASNADPRTDTSAASNAEVSSGRRWGVQLGASAELNNWLAPWPARSFGGSVELVAPSRAWSARAVGVYGLGERVVTERRAAFSYWGGHLDLCPVAAGSTRTWRWTSCAELHAGLLRAEGDESSALASASSRQALMLTAAAGTRLQTPPLWALRLEVEAGLAVPVLRQTFQFGSPEQTLFQSPDVGLSGRVGVLFPLDGQPDPKP
jgi:hypothetical protein